MLEQRIQEAKEKNEKLQEERKRKERAAWTHGFDEKGFLVYSNPVLRKSQYECPEEYDPGKLPTPSDHAWEDIFKTIDNKNEGAIDREMMEASIKAEEGLSQSAKSAVRKRICTKIMGIFSRTPSHSDVITFDDWKEMSRRLPELSANQIRQLVEQFSLRPKAYYKLEESADASTTPAARRCVS